MAKAKAGFAASAVAGIGSRPSSLPESQEEEASDSFLWDAAEETVASATTFPSRVIGGATLAIGLMVDGFAVRGRMGSSWYSASDMVETS